VFNIIKTLQNYFTREITTQQSQRKLRAAIFGGKMFGGSVLPTSAAPVVMVCL